MARGPQGDLDERSQSLAQLHGPPVLAAILTYVVAEGALVYGSLPLLVYAMGRGVPVVLTGTFTGAPKPFQAAGRWSGTIERASGVIMIAVGLFFTWIA